MDFLEGRWALHFTSLDKSPHARVGRMGDELCRFMVY
jgi:hypothetical protein